MFHVKHICLSFCNAEKTLSDKSSRRKELYAEKREDRDEKGLFVAKIIQKVKKYNMKAYDRYKERRKRKISKNIDVKKEK